MIRNNQAKQSFYVDEDVEQVQLLLRNLKLDYSNFFSVNDLFDYLYACCEENLNSRHKGIEVLFKNHSLARYKFHDYTVADLTAELNTVLSRSLGFKDYHDFRMHAKDLGIHSNRQ